MEKYDLVLSLHGEVPNNPGSDITELNAEEAFLPTLIMLHQRFPSLRIVLEHCTSTSGAALAAVRACGPSVTGTPHNKNTNRGAHTAC
jgi:dihydroorotase